MGRRALAKLVADGLDVFITRKAKVSEIVDSVNAGEHTRLTSLDACNGHEPGGGRRHGGGQGRGLGNA